MKRLIKALAAVMPSVLVLIGAVATAAGVGMIYFPAGVIAGGVLAMSGGIVLILGGDDDG